MGKKIAESMESMTYLYLCTKALIYGLFQKGRVLAQDGVGADAVQENDDGA